MLVAVMRDTWEWAAIIIGVTAAFSALVGFGYWILEQRRRPEVHFIWSFSPTENASDLKPWPPDYQPTIRLGQTFLVEASLQNVGDASGERSMTNFVVADCFKLQQHPLRTEGKELEGRNGVAGFAPGLWARFIVRERPFHPTMAWLHRYLLTLESTPPSEGARFLMALSDDRLNATGWRWWPSLIASSGWNDPAPFGTPWLSGRKLLRRRIGVIEMQPIGEPIRASRGERQSVRDVLIASECGR